MAQFYGNHFFISDRSTLKRLIDSQSFSEKTQAQLLDVYNKLPQYGLFIEFETYVEVVGQDVACKVSNNGSDCIIRVSPKIIMNSRITERVVFLAENIRDTRLYKRIGQVFLKQKRLLSLININFDAVGGGGSCISEQYQSYLTEGQKLCFCLVDSDKKYAKDSLGGTASRLCQIHENHIRNSESDYFCSYYIIPIREIENMVPTSILFEVVDGNEQRRVFMNLFEQLERTSPKARFYIDIKNGVNLRDIMVSNNKPEIDYWLQQLRPFLDKCNYLKWGECRDDCSFCVIISGMGENILPNVIDKFQIMTPQKILETLSRNPLVLEQWMKTGENIFQWCCCPYPRYAN
jgi:hypothetical protein